MKKQKKILWKKGIRFAFSEKWNTRFASFKKFYFPQNLCFLKTKLGRPVVWGGQLKHLHCGKKALHTQTSWIRDVPLCANAESGVSTQSVSTLYGKVKSKATRYFISSSGSLLKLQADKVLSSAENLDHEYCREKSLLKAVTGLSANTVLEHPSSTTFTSETERAVMTLGQESGTGAVSEDKVKLPASGPDTSVSSLDRPAASEEPLKTENFQMEEDGSLKQNILSSKLLDHPYCKSPLDAPLVCDELKIENQVAGGRSSQKAASPVDDEQLSTCLSGFLDEVMKKYGSLVPLSEKDVLGRLKDVFNEDFSNRKPFINREITNYRARHQKCNFRIFYNKHMLDMDDLATLDGQNWLNDQVINMYGELIMDAVPDKVHFFNSFFHRQLVTKGYNGVKRWTKKVDLFKKSLLLIPIHLEVHWSLITVTLSNRIISFYDSQGIHFKFCVENIRKYLLTEAREKNRPEFLQGWQTAVTKCIPQQKNDSDCGVFVLQYCKCLALEQPFQFSQEDMPRVRKRIYKELCECRLLD
ncbi:sentrin-specific protease 5 isoform X1 [Sigmodon hispidus]